MNDTTVANLIAGEEQRERDGLELIPSENYVSGDVLAALGSVFTNKYSEGYPGKRYYGGQQFTDQVEQLAIDRAKELFHADHANVQPHSGAPANEAVYSAWCEPGDTILAMDLSHGGHLTHGSPVTRSAHLYNFIRYKMKDPATGEIDYDELRQLALEHKPKIILAGYSAYPREVDFEKFAEIGREVGALLMADMAHVAGLIAGGVANNPLDHGFHVMTTTTHKTLRGPRAGMIMCRAEHAKAVDSRIFPGIQGGPLMHVIAAKAAAFGEALRPEFKAYARSVLANMQVLAAELTGHGLRLVSGGTDNHLMLVDLTRKDITGKDAEIALDTAGITVNKNTVPFETRSPFVTSGVRIGTAALTTRGMKEDDMRTVGAFIVEAIEKREDAAALEKISQNVEEFARQFPLFAW